MRSNELVAGVGGDIAVKVFVDDFGAMSDTANRIAAILRKTPGAVDVRVEQTEGLPMLDIRPDRDALSRFGITAQAVQDTVSAAIRGRAAGVIVAGDRRFAAPHRLDPDIRAAFQSPGQLPVPLARHSLAEGKR